MENKITVIKIADFIDINGNKFTYCCFLDKNNKIIKHNYPYEHTTEEIKENFDFNKNIPSKFRFDGAKFFYEENFNSTIEEIEKTTDINIIKL